MENEIVRNCGTCRFYDATICGHYLNAPKSIPRKSESDKPVYVGTRKKVTFSDYCQLWMFKPTEK